MTRVLIIGCGQLGSRHLQAVASLPQVYEIEVVDPRSVSLLLGQQRLNEISGLQSHIQFRWLADLQDVSHGGDLCIVATQAEGRRALVEQVAAMGYRQFLLEKIVTQSVAEYDQLLTFAKSHQLSIWVNCKSRAHPIWKHVKEKLEPEEPLIYTSIGGNHGLANNGVHVADLFVFFTSAERIKSMGGWIDPVAHPTKRGQFDLTGSLHGYSSNGSSFILSYAQDHVGSPIDMIITRQYRWVVDQMKRQAFEATEKEGGALQAIPFEGDLTVSNLTKIFAADILRSGRCELPTLAECYPAHQFILSELLPSFNRLLGKDDDRCPVT